MAWLCELLEKFTEGFIMTQLKNLEQTINELDEPVKKALLEMLQVLLWFYEWLQNLEETISKEN